MDDSTTIKALKEKVKEFCEKRDWDQYHDGKELAIGLIIEAAELLEHFRWKNKEEIKEVIEKKREDVEDELADILFAILRIAQRYNIDLTTALTNKIRKNDEKYPVEKVKGKNKKYDEY